MTTCPHGYVAGPGGGCFHEIGLSGVTLEGEDPCPEHGPGLSCGCMGRSFGGVRVWDGGAGRAAALNVAAAYAFEHRPNGPYNDDWDPSRTPYGMGPGYPVPETVMIPSGDLPGWSGCETDLDRLRHPAINPAWLGDPLTNERLVDLGYLGCFQAGVAKSVGADGYIILTNIVSDFGGFGDFGHNFQTSGYVMKDPTCHSGLRLLNGLCFVPLPDVLYTLYTEPTNSGQLCMDAKVFIGGADDKLYPTATGPGAGGSKCPPGMRAFGNKCVKTVKGYGLPGAPGSAPSGRGLGALADIDPGVGDNATTTLATEWDNQLVAFPCQPVELYIGPQDVIVRPTGGAWPADFATYKTGETLPHKFWQAKAIGQQAWDVVPAPGVEIAQIFGAYALYTSGSIRHFVTGKCGPKGGGSKLPPRGHGFPGHGSGSGVRGIGLGTVYDPSDIAHVIGTLLGGNQIIAPPPPTWASGQDWTGMLKNAGAAIYSALNPGAGPPPPDNAIGTLQAYVTAAANMLKQYGPGGGATLPGTIPAIPGIPAIDHLNPMLMGLPAYLGGILPGLLTLPGVIPIPPVPTGIDPASYLAAVSNLATTLFGTMFPGRTTLPTIPEAFDFMKAAGIMLQHYLPGAPPATVDPPLAPPKVIDCGLPGWFFDDGQGQCVPIPGYPPPPHIGPTGCTVPGTVVQADGSCAPNPTTPAPPAVTKVQCADGTTVDDIAKCPKPKAVGGGAGGGSNTAMYVLGGLGVLALIGVAAAAAANPAPAGKKK